MDSEVVAHGAQAEIVGEGDVVLVADFFEEQMSDGSRANAASASVFDLAREPPGTTRRPESKKRRFATNPAAPPSLETRDISLAFVIVAPISSLAVIVIDRPEPDDRAQSRAMPRRANRTTRPRRGGPGSGT